MTKPFNMFVYILTNKNKTVLYIGVTNNLERRLAEHKLDAEGLRKSFCGRYNCYYLVYFEEFKDRWKLLPGKKN